MDAAGSAAKYEPTGSFDFPVGTILSKTFFYPRAHGGAQAVARTYDQSRDFAGEGLDLGNVRLIETRILVRREHGWEALPYVWNAAQTDANLRAPAMRCHWSSCRRAGQRGVHLRGTE